jgi:flagellar hook assembly protein FlgD
MSAHQMEALRQNVLTRRTGPNGRTLLGPSGRSHGDHLGIAAPSEQVEPWSNMPALHRSVGHSIRESGSTRRRDVFRALAVVLSILALILTSSALNLVDGVSAADPSAPRKAVIVSGPVHSLTTKYKGYAKAIADSAEAQGMDVKRVFHPNAPKSRVKRLAQGADLFVYVGHGNGWPSAYGPFQEDTKNGLGLDPEDPDDRGPNTVVYKGANWLRDNIELAPNAVVILSHLSYASGNASSGMPIPSRSVAVERVDNFANGFLAIGAQVVWALGWQPGADIVKALHKENATMDAIFMTRYRSNINPLNGWMGINPGYYQSVRVPGATVHIDPHPTYGYLRGITGNLDFTTNAWRNAEAAPPDSDPPVISEVSATQASATVATTDSELPVFTPNGDSISDSIKINHRLSESAFVEMRVKKDGKLIRRVSNWSLEGKGSTSWNGRRDDGEYVGEGLFRIILTPTDRAGNHGEPKDLRVRVLNSMKNPTVNPPLIYAADEDELGQTSALKARLTRQATASWIIRNTKGAVVRRGIDAVDYDPGDVRFVWDGKDDEGSYVPDGKYRARIKVVRPSGSYAHDLTVRVMPFKMFSPTWKMKRGQTTTLTFETAEPMQGRPLVTANQPGIAKYGLKVTKLSPTKFKAKLATKNRGKAGDMKIRIFGTDQGGGTQWKIFTIKLR